MIEKHAGDVDGQDQQEQEQTASRMPRGDRRQQAIPVRRILDGLCQSNSGTTSPLARHCRSIQVELIFGGKNLPVRAPDLYAGVV